MKLRRLLYDVLGGIFQNVPIRQENVATTRIMRKIGASPGEESQFASFLKL